MAEHTILVAFTVDAQPFESEDGRPLAELVLHDRLGQVRGRTLTDRGTFEVTSWWVAEDDRHDGSDNDSAVFVPMGTQPTHIAQPLADVHTRRALAVAILALRTVQEPDATSEADWQQLLDEADAAVTTLTTLLSRG